MKKKGISFKLVYLIYLALLVILVAVSLKYVSGILHKYEDLRPEKRIEQAMDELVADAASGDFWNKYSMAEVKAGKFEEHLDVQNKYLNMYDADKVEYSKKIGIYGEDELYYLIKNDDNVLAEVKLKAAGPTVTKLVVLSYREWNVEYVKPLFEAEDYKVSVPVDFRISVNGIRLTPEDGVINENEITYAIKNMYFEPEFSVKDEKGQTVSYALKNNEVIAEFYNYVLTIPKTLTLELNGEACEGEPVGEDRIRYDIRTLKKPEVKICDYYGNVINYEGGVEVPLTYMTVTADSRCDVKISGKAIPDEVTATYENKEYEQLVKFVDKLPQIKVYDIAILEKDAELTVINEYGNPLTVEQGKMNYDFMAEKSVLEAVPAEVSAEVDVLDIAQKWSLFMSSDVKLKDIDKYLIADSYQREVAVKYATGIDITFISNHTLLNPAFTGNEVTNFAWIADNCFSVDISFVKHMYLTRTKVNVDDSMNDRFYFVKCDDTNDNVDNPTWKIASMKEIVDNEK